MGHPRFPVTAQKRWHCHSVSDSASDFNDNDIGKHLFELSNGTMKHHTLNSGSLYLHLGHVHIVNHQISAVCIWVLPIGRSGPYKKIYYKPSDQCLYLSSTLWWHHNCIMFGSSAWLELVHFVNPHISAVFIGVIPRGDIIISCIIIESSIQIQIQGRWQLHIELVHVSIF